jgi:asparagine synthase (glutamine-hydrolysing)
MVAAMSHRGPDGKGFRSDEARRCVLGHARLAILDTSDAGLQPMGTPDRRHWIVYNGEVYNHSSLRERMESAGERFTTGTDTEVVLRWLALHGVRGLEDLNGMFALGLWDERERRLLLARDSFGIKPLYVSRLENGTVAFASEVRALLATG